MLSPAQTAQPSPAQPSQPAQLSGKKMHHFQLLFSSKIFKEHEIILFQKRKNKIIFGPKIFRERIKNARFVFIFFVWYFMVFCKATLRFKYPRRDFHPGFTITFWSKFMIFDNFSIKMYNKKSTRRYVNWNFHVNYNFSSFFMKINHFSCFFRWKSMIFDDFSMKIH